MPIDEKDMQQITRRLDERYVKRDDCDNTQKDMLYRRLCRCANALDAEGTLSVHPVPDAFRTAIMECFADGSEMNETDTLPN